MGASGPIKGKYEYCGTCGLKISFSEYVCLGGVKGKKDHCEQHHQDLLKKQKAREYDYEKAFLSILFFLSLFSLSSTAFAEVPLISKLNETPIQVITPYSTAPLNLTTLHNSTHPAAEIDMNCLPEENHSNFTERIWSKYCVDPQTEADYYDHYQQKWPAEKPLTQKQIDRMVEN